MSSVGAAPRAVVPVSSARAEASRKNGARSHGPRTPEGKARSARNALKHGMRAQTYVVLPEEDGAEFAELEAALIAELAPVGALQTVLARRVAVAAWRLARADRIEAELFAERGYDAAGPGLALIRDGNGTRSFETLLRYRGAAMAEFCRALRTLKALQAEQAAAELRTATPACVRAQPRQSAARSQNADRPEPSEPERHLDSPSEHRLGTSCPTETAARSTSPRRPGRRTNPKAAPEIPLAPALPVAHGERATGRAIAGVLTPWAAGGGGGRRRAPGR